MDGAGGDRPNQRADGGGAIGHVGVHLAQPVDVELGVGEQAVLRLHGPGQPNLAGLGRGDLGAGGDAAAEHRLQVLQGHQIRAQVAGQHRSRQAGLDPHPAVQVAVADAAVEALVAIDAVVAGQGSGDLVGRGVGQGQAGELVEVGHVRAVDVEAGGKDAEVERLGDLTLGQNGGGAGMDVGVEGVGTARVDVEQRPAGQVQTERLLVEGPLAAQAEALHPLGPDHFAGGDRANELEMAHLIVDGQAPVVDLKSADGRQAGRLARRLALEGPVVGAVGVAEEGDVGLIGPDQRQDHLAVEQRFQLDRNRQLLNRRHVAGPAGWVGDAQALDRGGGGPAQQFDVQMAIDGDRSADAA